ncbi:uncharacterized protein LOC114936075 [Nylanderia fulva]|uniref:uncharacterized protein LOC114936075 n=1 Tax=Nylanderia fulva TaxID=613905 RepID=UPI0010FB0BA1|nr:uncharacterized protein LOC114936075 [Nylanderia fulva]
MEQDNISYAQSVNDRESAYSDNGQIDSCQLNYMQQRNREESLYKKWLIQRRNLVQTYQRRMKDVVVQSGEKFVSFARKWYISQGYSFVPEVIDLKDKLKFGTYHPISEKILDIIDKIQRSIDTYMHRFITVHRFMYNARRSYKDMQFSINSNVITEIKLIFTENVWPSDIRKLNIRDTIVVKLTLNENVQICNVVYKYIYIQASKDTKENIYKLGFKLKNFYNFPLEVAFDKFMKEENCSERENSESTI